MPLSYAVWGERLPEPYRVSRKPHCLGGMESMRLRQARFGHRLGPAQGVVAIFGREGVVDVRAGIQPSGRVVPVVGLGSGQGRARRIGHPVGIGARPGDAGQTVHARPGTPPEVIDSKRSPGIADPDLPVVIASNTARPQHVGVPRRCPGRFGRGPRRSLVVRLEVIRLTSRPCHSPSKRGFLGA